MKMNFRGMSSAATVLLLLVLTLSGAAPKKVTASDGDQSDDSIDPNPNNLPNELAAYVLHGRYVFSSNGGQAGYYGKQVTVSGVAETQHIRLITERSLFGTEYIGQYMVPLMSRNKVVCILPYSPMVTRLVSSKSAVYVIKVSGEVKRGENFQQIVIANSKLLKSRSIRPERTSCPVGNRSKMKSPAFPDNVDKDNKDEEGQTSYCNYLMSVDELERWQWLVLGHGVTRRICDMGSDPEAYAAELEYIFRKRYSDDSKHNASRGASEKSQGSYRLLVSISGKSERTGTTSRLKNCRILGWRYSKAKELR